MEKTFLEQKIKERANQKAEKEYQEFVDWMYKNPFAKRLILKIKNEKIPLVNFGVNFGIFNNRTDNKELENTNFQEVLQERKDYWEKNETDNLLKQMENLNYFFQENL